MATLLPMQHTVSKGRITTAPHCELGRYKWRETLLMKYCTGGSELSLSQARLLPLLHDTPRVQLQNFLGRTHPLLIARVNGTVVGTLRSFLSCVHF